MPAFSRWTRASLIRHTLIVAAAAVLVILVTKISVAGVLRARYPDIALTWWSGDSDARARQAFLLVADGVKPAVREKSRNLALAALRRSPTNVEALRTLGMIAEVQGQPASAKRLFEQVERLSRRDMLTQLWFIEYYSRAGDIDRTLQHYDTALRTSRDSRTLLFPVLVQASSDPALVKPISRRLATRPLQWWIDFSRDLIDQAPNPVRAAAILNPVLNPRDPEERELIGRLIGRLASSGAYDLAWRTYADATRRAGGVVSDALVRDGDFESAALYPPLDWQLVSEPDLYASRASRPDRTDDDVLEVTAMNGRSGEAARQLLRLPAGRYRLQFEVGEKPGDWDGNIEVVVVCTSPARQLIAVPGYVDDRQQGRRGGAFEIVSGCATQWLSIRATSDGPPPSSAPWIDKINIRAAAGGDRSNQMQR